MPQTVVGEVMEVVTIVEVEEEIVREIKETVMMAKNRRTNLKEEKVVVAEEVDVAVSEAVEGEDASVDFTDAEGEEEHDQNHRAKVAERETKVVKAKGSLMKPVMVVIVVLDLVVVEAEVVAGDEDLLVDSIVEVVVVVVVEAEQPVEGVIKREIATQRTTVRTRVQHRKFVSNNNTILHTFNNLAINKRNCCNT